MKNKIKIIILFLGMVFLAVPLSAQVMAPGDPGNDPQPGNPPIGGGAPVGSGLFILTGLAAAYAGKKVYIINKEDLEE